MGHDSFFCNTNFKFHYPNAQLLNLPARFAMASFLMKTGCPRLPQQVATPTSWTS
jgi:hypothetical protein